MAGRNGTERDGTVFFWAKFLAGRDGCFLFRGGTGRGVFFQRRDGAVVFFPEAGRVGCCFFPRRDGAVVFFFRSGTRRLYFFFEAGRDGVVVFFQRRDRAVVLFVAPGRAFFFSAGTGRLTIVVFSAGTVLFIRVPSGGG